jgi:hypothetical protein
MDSSFLQQTLGRYLFDRKHTAICGNFQTVTLPECDLISVNLDGLLCEWEIKISRSDFLADLRKTQKHLNLSKGTGTTYLKSGGQQHLRFVTCSYFSYVCPAHLILPHQVPVYAGLIWVYEGGKVEIQKAAPQRHSVPADAYILGKIAHNLCQKYLFGCSRATFATKENRPDPDKSQIQATQHQLFTSAQTAPRPSGRQLLPPANPTKGRRLRKR